MRTMIAVPCMDMVHTLFFSSMMNLHKPEGTEIAVSCSSLVYNARNLLAKKAIDEGFDRVLWLDSDMVFDADLMDRLSADMDKGLQYVCGLFFTRKNPLKPCIYKYMGNRTNENGEEAPAADPYTDYPREQVFPVDGSGFAAVMMTTDLIRKCGPSPFFPIMGFGEDFTFCLRAREAGATLWCDSAAKVAHIGQSLATEDVFIRQQRREGD